MGIFDDYMKFEEFGSLPGLASMGSGLGSMLGGGHKDPMKQGNQFWNQIPGEMQKYFAPYMQQGAQSMGAVNNQYNSLVNDPSATYNKVAQGYHQSPGFQWQMNQGMNAANNAAAAGGMLGSPQHQQQAATMAEGIANQDFNNYMGHGLGLYGTGLQGMQGMSNQGYQANSQMARIMADLLSNQGQSGFNNIVSQNQAKGAQMGDIFGSLSAILPYLLMM